jgi:DNA-binding NarL/FixJ family response regulator
MSQAIRTVPAMSETRVTAGKGFVSPVRIAVLFASGMMRRGCAVLIDAAPDLEVVYEGHPDELVELAVFDVVVVGIASRSDAGAYAIQRLAAKDACVLAVAGPGMNPSTAIELGAHACIDGLDSDESAVPTAIARLVRGDAAVVPGRPVRELAAISPREREVLRELAKGRTDQEIAVTLGISVRTVQSHLDRIREKTKRRRRAELTVLALELGIVPRDDPS